MKKLLAIFVFFICLVAHQANAAIAAGAVWEVRVTNGLDTNGGGFVPAVTLISSKTDLVVSAGSNLNVSSTSYGFTSADIGRWINVTAGTGFTTGLYQIKSVATGVATLSSSPAAVNTTGGSFTVYYGLDYSQQNAKNVNGGTNGSSVLGTYAAGTTITCADCQFTNDIDGNIVYLAGGTGSITAGWYQATYGSATTITVDRSTGLVAGTGITVNIGGALQSLNQAGTNAVNSNKVFVKAEATYSISATSTFATAPWVIGYATTRGDGGPVTVQDTATASIAIITLSNNAFFQNFTVDCNSQTGTTGILATGGPVIFYNTVKSCTSYGIRSNTGNLGVAYIINNEVTGDGSSSNGGIFVNPTAGILLAAEVLNNYVHDGAATGIITNGSISTIVGNIVVNRSGTTSRGISSSAGIVMNNTVYNSGQYDIYTTGGLGGIFIFNNLVTNAGSTGLFSNTAQAASLFTDGNAYYSNTAGNTSGLNLTTGSYGVNPYVNSHDVVLSGSPYVSTSGYNFAPNAVGGAGGAIRNTGIPQTWVGLGSTMSQPDFGAVTHATSSSSGGAYSFGQ